MAILDFNKNGGAMIEIPQINNDYSLVVNHWKSVENQLQEIEKDFRQSDSSERTDFLKKYAEELQKHETQFLECDKYDEYLYDSVEPKESEEEKQFYHDERNRSIYFFDNHYEECLFIYNFRLKHSLAWYLMTCVSDEIAKIEQKIEIWKGVAKISNQFDEVIIIIRKAENNFAACKQLMQQFPLSELQAKAVANLSLYDMQKNEFEDNLAFLEYQEAFLKKLKR